MQSSWHHLSKATRRERRVRNRVRGTTERPRLTVFRSNKYIYLQVIDDSQGKTLAGTSSYGVTKAGTKTEAATVAAAELAKKLAALKVSKLVFDRGSYKYHGRVRAVAEAMREQGLEV